MSLSPKHTTPFSVTDILNPIEEYKKNTIEAAIPPLVSPYRSPSQHQSAMSSMGSMGGMSTNPYHNYVPQLSHHPSSFPSQYCNGGDLSHYADPMSSGHRSGSWYGNATDPRLASKYGYRVSCRFSLAPHMHGARPPHLPHLPSAVVRVFQHFYSL